MNPISILGWITFGLLGGYIAAHKGYSPRWGIVLGVFLGPIGLVIAAVMPRTRAGQEQAELERQIQSELQHSRQTRDCPRCGRENSVVTPVCPQCDLRLVPRQS